VLEMAKKLGLGDLRDMTSMPIGSSEVTVIDMAAAYSVFANGGRRAKPYAALEIRNSRDQMIYTAAAARGPQSAGHPSSVAADMNCDDEQGDRGGHRQARPAARHQGGGQDRHIGRIQERLVRRLYRQLCRRRLVRQRRLQPDREHDRRLAAGAGLARHHAIAHTDIELKPLYGVEGENAQRGLQVVTAAQPPVRPGTEQTAARGARLSRKGSTVISNIESAMRAAADRRGAALQPAVSPYAQAFRPLDQASRAN
jgi:hypothetical protein